jgi:hypothetical protein
MAFAAVDADTIPYSRRVAAAVGRWPLAIALKTARWARESGCQCFTNSSCSAPSAISSKASVVTPTGFSPSATRRNATRASRTMSPVHGPPSANTSFPNAASEIPPRLARTFPDAGETPAVPGFFRSEPKRVLGLGLPSNTSLSESHSVLEVTPSRADGPLRPFTPQSAAGPLRASRGGRTFRAAGRRARRCGRRRSPAGSGAGSPAVARSGIRRNRTRRS